MSVTDDDGDGDGDNDYGDGGDYDYGYEMTNEFITGKDDFKNYIYLECNNSIRPAQWRCKIKSGSAVPID